MGTWISDHALNVVLCLVVSWQQLGFFAKHFILVQVHWRADIFFTHKTVFTKNCVGDYIIIMKDVSIAQTLLFPYNS